MNSSVDGLPAASIITLRSDEACEYETVLTEEFMEGEEASFFALSDGHASVMGADQILAGRVGGQQSRPSGLIPDHSGDRLQHVGSYLRGAGRHIARDIVDHRPDHQDPGPGRVVGDVHGRPSAHRVTEERHRADDSSEDVIGHGVQPLAPAKPVS